MTAASAALALAALAGIAAQFPPSDDFFWLV